MKFVSIREFRANAAQVRKALKKEQEIILTVKGKPAAMLVEVSEEDLEDNLRAVRSSRLLRALDGTQKEAKKKGLDKLTMKQIDAIIAQSRRERRRRLEKRGA